MLDIMGPRLHFVARPSDFDTLLDTYAGFAGELFNHGGIVRVPCYGIREQGSPLLGRNIYLRFLNIDIIPSILDIMWPRLHLVTRPSDFGPLLDTYTGSAGALFNHGGIVRVPYYRIREQGSPLRGRSIYFRILEMGTHPL